MNKIFIIPVLLAIAVYSIGFVLDIMFNPVWWVIAIIGAVLSYKSATIYNFIFSKKKK